MKVLMDYKQGVLSAKIQGELDHHTAAELRDSLDLEIESRAIKRLVLDFSGVPFMDSSGIGVIVGRYKKLDGMGGETEVINICPAVDKILELSGIKTIIPCRKEGENE